MALKYIILNLTEIYSLETIGLKVKFQDQNLQITEI